MAVLILLRRRIDVVLLMLRIAFEMAVIVPVRFMFVAGRIAVVAVVMVTVIVVMIRGVRRVMLVLMLGMSGNFVRMLRVRDRRMLRVSRGMKVIISGSDFDP